MDNTSTAQTGYDIIVVGGGTAGCVLAARLSEVDTLEVLLLEAGGDHNDDPRVKIPMMFGQAIGDHNLDWDYHAIPQEHLINKPTVHPRGKGLGGSTLVNLMHLNYPTRSIYDAWAAAGNPGWGWDDMLPYLRKFQNYNAPSKEVHEALGLGNINEAAQGCGGPVQASHPGQVYPLDKAWIETFRNLDRSLIVDTMSGETVGAFCAVAAVDPISRERCHAAKAYLEAAKARPNLTIIPNASVTKVILTGNRATGVVYSNAGKPHTAEVSKEVVLCCGTFETPALLERSGIGRAEVLKDLAVDPVVVNDNVGENLHDHIVAACSFELDDAIDTMDNFRDYEYIQRAMKAFQETQSGPLAATFPTTAHLPLLDGTENMDVDAILASYTVKPRSAAAFQVAERLVGRLVKENKEASAVYTLVSGQAQMEHNNVLRDMFTPIDPGKYMTIFVALSHPLSRGSVHARSLDVGDLTIDPRYYTHPLDLELMARHLQTLPKILDTEPLRSLLKPRGRRIPAWASFDSLQDTTQLLRRSNMSFYHPVGSCSMLPEASGGVVDERLRVYGVRGLRVCDASIMPVVPKGPIMTSVYAIAEKGADMLKQDVLGSLPA